jgi:DHA1 family multidrug resistance protein-like MFS transporter
VLEPSLDHVAPPAAAPSLALRVVALTRGLDRSLALLAGLSFASQLIVATMLPILPLLAIEVGAKPVVLGLMVSVSAVAAAGGQAIAGVVSDRAGPRRLLPAGLVGYGAASLLTAAAASAGPLVAIRGLSGLGSGMYIVGERLYIRHVVDRARLAFANGLVQAAAAVGFVIGPVIGGAAAELTDLRTPIVIVGVGSLVVAVAAMFLPARQQQESAAARIDCMSSLTDRRALGILLLANLALVIGYGSFITTFTPFATDDLGWTTTEIGVAFSLFGVGNVLVGPWIGATADRLGRRRVGALAVIPIVAFAVVLVLPVPSALYFPLALAAGGGVAGFTASWFALLGVATGGPRAGRAFGTITAVSSLGIIVGALAAGLLWESIAIRAAMVVTIVAMVLAGVLLAAYPEVRHVAPIRDAEPN